MIGFFGGSFDPVHFGHLKTARAIKKELKLERLFLMPCRAAVHKQNLHFSNEQRLQMLNLALKEFDDLSLSTEEIHNQAHSYTIDTLKRLKIKYPNQPLCLIMGSDSFATINTWRDYQQLRDYAQLVVLPRKGSVNHPDKSVYFAKTPQLDISSTQIRSLLINPDLMGKIPLSQMMPDAVIQYIHQLSTSKPN